MSLLLVYAQQCLTSLLLWHTSPLTTTPFHQMTVERHADK